MPRTLSRSEQTYPAGVYGPFAVDSFTNANTDRLELEMTVVGWPDVSPLLEVELAWDAGGGAKFDVSGAQALPSVRFSVSVPRMAGQKQGVSGGTVVVRTFAPITTALTLRAI